MIAAITSCTNTSNPSVLMEMWGSLKHAPAQQWGGESKRTGIRLVTIAAKAGPVASNQGPKTVADFGFADAPQLDYLLVPGGIGAIPLVQDATTLDWLRARAKKARLVMTILLRNCCISQPYNRATGTEAPATRATTTL